MFRMLEAGAVCCRRLCVGSYAVLRSSSEWLDSRVLIWSLFSLLFHFFSSSFFPLCLS
jgi:hypothetical protein